MIGPTPQDTVESRAPWVLVPPGVDAGADASANANGDDANAVFRVPVEVQQQLQSERARNEEMAADLRALMDRFVRLKNEQVPCLVCGV